MIMWGIIPAAGSGTRIQPLSFSKELLPVGSWYDGQTERPKAVSEYLVDRFLNCGVSKLCFIIAPRKSDILQHYGNRHPEKMNIAFVVQPQPAGLCDAIFRAVPFIREDEFAVIGLPDTIWFPENALSYLGSDDISLLLFPVENPQVFDAVSVDSAGSVLEIQVKHSDPNSYWIWGAIKLSGAALHGLHRLWIERSKQDEFLGTLINAWIARGGVVKGFKTGETYLDVGTVNGYRQALQKLHDKEAYSH